MYPIVKNEIFKTIKFLFVFLNQKLSLFKCMTSNLLQSTLAKLPKLIASFSMIMGVTCSEINKMRNCVDQILWNVSNYTAGNDKMIFDAYENLRSLNYTSICNLGTVLAVQYLLESHFSSQLICNQIHNVNTLSFISLSSWLSFHKLNSHLSYFENQLNFSFK